MATIIIYSSAPDPDFINIIEKAPADNIRGISEATTTYKKLKSAELVQLQKIQLDADTKIQALQATLQRQITTQQSIYDVVTAKINQINAL